MSGWIPPPPMTTRTEPYLFARADLGALREYLAGRGAGIAELDVSGAGSISEVIGQMKDVLPFPGWMGNGWDSVFDATEELRAELTFPCAVVIGGYDRLLATHPHDALQLTIRLTDLERELGFKKAQLIVYYEVEVWT